MLRALADAAPRIDARDGVVEHLALDRLPGAVLLVEPDRELLGARRHRRW